MDEELGAHLEAMETRLRQGIEDSETRLLSEFWKWARTAEVRYRQSISKVEATVSQVDILAERVTIAEDRISALEAR